MVNYAAIRERDDGGKFVVPTIPSGINKKETRRRYYLFNKERIAKKASEWNRKNKERRKQIKDKWRSKNKAHVALLSRNYLYRKKGAKGFLTKKQEDYLYDIYKTCPYCNTNPSDTIDHILPLSRGGTNELHNLIPACRSCNSKKRDKTMLEFKPLLFIMFDRLADNRRNMP